MKGTTPDIRPGQLFMFPKKSREVVYELHQVTDDGTHVFVAKSGRSTTKLGRSEVIEKFSTTGEIIRVHAEGELSKSDSYTYIDPRTFLDPDEASGKVERSTILKLKRRYLKALTQQFYTRKYDASPYPGRTEPKLRAFIREHADEAKSLGLDPDFSASTLRRSIRNCGREGARDLHHFLRTQDTQREPIWDPFILSLKSAMIDEYWSSRAPKLWEVQNDFDIRLKNKNTELSRFGVPQLAAPDKETRRLWLKQAENYHRCEARCGKIAAGRRFRGQSRAIQASRPLEYVMFDHTRADAWANVENDSGQVLMQERPWLVMAVDVYSRMPLAALLTFEHPSVNTVVMCLKQIVRKKEFLPADLINFKNFGDSRGKPNCIIVDCAWENSEVSFQTMCESLGINIIWAPIHTPEFKCHVEHEFHVLNQIYWHQLPSGIPHKPHVMSQLRLNPRSKADRNLAEMTDGLWYAIRKVAFSENSALGMSPALAWQDGVEQHGLPMIDDIKAFDSFLGRVKSGRLSRSGIEYKNQRFHDPLITSALLNDLLRFARKSDQRKSAASSGVVRVHFTIDETCESVRVWNPRTKLNVRLPNILTNFSKGLTWKEADDCRQFARERNRQFCSEDEMSEVLVALRATYEPTAASASFREARKLATRFTLGTRLVTGSVVEEVFEQPSDSGLGRNIPNAIAAQERSDDRPVIRTCRRGGAAATKKAMATKAANQKKRGSAKSQFVHEVPEPPATQEGAVGQSVWTEVHDAAGLLADLRNNL